MAILELSADKEGLAFDEKAARARGKALAETYQNAEPFPHICLDDLIDRAALERVIQEFPDAQSAYHAEYRQEKLKYQFTPDRIRSRYVREMLDVLNTSAVLGFLEEMTGIEGLIPDPYFLGGGLHETKRGGFLGVHADFNLHKKLRLRRRLNLLVYLNDDWADEYGGDLELWDREMKTCKVKVAPRLGKSVVFSTDSTSYHGHPDPVQCPEDRTRRSIALYYYTSDAEAFDDTDYHTTLFKARPHDDPKMNQGFSAKRLAKDLLPPILYRLIK